MKFTLIEVAENSAVCLLTAALMSLIIQGPATKRGQVQV